VKPIRILIADDHRYYREGVAMRDTHLKRCGRGANQEGYRCRPAPEKRLLLRAFAEVGNHVEHRRSAAATRRWFARVGQLLLAAADGHVSGEESAAGVGYGALSTHS
jgi:hypothetical protein